MSPDLILTGITKEELFAHIEHTVRTVVNERYGEPIGTRQLTKELGISRSTAYRRRKSGNLKTINSGGHPKYDRSVIDKMKKGI